jgi:hypothetical protein
LVKNLVGVNKRMTSLLVVSAHEAKRQTNWVISLTAIIIVMTGALLYLAFKTPPQNLASPVAPSAVNPVNKN